MTALLRLSISILLLLTVVACSQLPHPADTVLEAQITETQRLTSSDSYFFGYSVAIDGDWMVAGAPNEISTTVTPYFGLVQLYQKDATGTWQFVKRLVASDGIGEGWFGHTVAINGNTIVVGAPYASVNSLTEAGAVYLDC
jgi:FG-GAP repeat